MRLKRLLLTLVMGVSFVATAAGKCPINRIMISGEILGAQVDGSQVVVVATFPRETIAAALAHMSNREFVSTLKFNTYKSAGRLFLDDCSRRPSLVTVILLVNNEEIDRVELRVSREFALYEDTGEYRLRKPILLGEDRKGDKEKEANHN